MAVNKTRKLCKQGTIKIVKGKRLVYKKSKWIPFESVSLNGYKALTAKILGKFRGKPLTVYEKQATDTWPTKRKDFDVKYTFTTSKEGDLKKSILEGVMKSKDIDSTLEVSHSGLVSTNLMNTDAFVKDAAK
jgi:hypothetical protein